MAGPRWATPKKVGDVINAAPKKKARHLRVGVDHGEEDILGGHDEPLGDGLDGEGQLAAVRGEDVLPPLQVELAGAHVVVEDLLRVVDDLLRHHGPLEVSLEKVLQAEEADLVELAAAALKVLPSHDAGEPGAQLASRPRTVCVGIHPPPVRLGAHLPGNLHTPTPNPSLSDCYSYR